MVLLKNVLYLEEKIDTFLNIVSECGLLFEQFVRLYLAEKYTDCEIKINRVRENEHLADKLRVQTIRYVYSHTLIPESRGDVLAILEGTDECVDQIKEIIVDMLIERPSIPSVLHSDMMELTSASANSVDEMIKAMRAFFYNIHQVSDTVNKVLFYEKEADDIAERLKKVLYASPDIGLAQKNHCKYYIRGIEKISDYAQNVADRLIIYTLKREI